MSERLENSGARHLEQLERQGIIALEGDVIRMCDLLTGEPLIQDEVPSSVHEDEIYGRGLATLERLGKSGRLSVDVLLNEHDGKASFDKLRTRHEDKLIDAAIVGMEAIWDGDFHEGEWTNARFVLSDGPGVNEYLKCMKKWLEEEDAMLLPCDIDYPEQGALRERFRQVWQWMVEDAPSQLQQEKQEVTYFAYQVSRQWAMAGQLGYWLEQLEAEGLLPSTAHVPLVLGSLHTEIGNKLAMYVPTTVYTDPTYDVASAEAFKKATNEGRVTLDEVRRSLRAKH